MDSETSVESQAAAALPSPMDSPSRAAGAAERSSSPTSPAPPGISTTVGPTGSGQQQAHVLLHGQQLQQAPLSIAASSLPTPSSSPPSLQHLQNQQAQQQAVPPISNADLLKYLAANGLNPADLEAILRQRAYQQQLAQAQGAADVADLEDRLNRRFGDLDLDGRNAMGYQQQLEEQRWLRQQQQQYRMQQEAALRGVPGSINAGRRQELMDPYEDLVMPSTGRMSPTGGRGYHPSMGSTALANNYENGISGTGSQASYDALRDGGVAPDSYANSLGGAFLNNLYGPGALNAYAASQQRKPFHQRDLPNVTPPEGYVCKLCFVEGHFLRHCPLYKERPRGEYDPYRKMFGDSVPPENYLCKVCRVQQCSRAIAYDSTPRSSASFPVTG
ncbi:hypothetical protein DFJ74DRAFT_497308 [Hyaloraphidium curvatum]|nr:hypothetical protein DFJ74DRAFT_497308 [Hyaloraphidium curvatum]